MTVVPSVAVATVSSASRLALTNCGLSSRSSGRVSSQGQLRKRHDIGACIPALADPVDNLAGVALEVSDDDVDLGHRETYLVRAAHDGIVTSTPPGGWPARYETSILELRISIADSSTVDPRWHDHRPPEIVDFLGGKPRWTSFSRNSRSEIDGSNGSCRISAFGRTLEGRVTAKRRWSSRRRGRHNALSL